MNTVDRLRGCLLGLACGDAVGTTVEFKQRGTFPLMSEMVGGGPFNLEAGEWTDDTSMALCIATSLTEHGRFDEHDIMVRFCRWWRDGYLSSNGRCFDIGITVQTALQRFQRFGEPFSGATDPNSAGNGCLMRLAPVPMFFHNDRDAAIIFAAESSRLTHAAVECIESSRLFAAMLHAALNGASKEAILGHADFFENRSEAVQAIARGDYRTKRQDQIRGSGYVIQSLEAALWCFDTTDTFEAAILSAANLGDDADTTAAITGQLAGAFYGEAAIPSTWLLRLAMVDKIRTLADQLHDQNHTARR